MVTLAMKNMQSSGDQGAPENSEWAIARKAFLTVVDIKEDHAAAGSELKYSIGA